MTPINGKFTYLGTINIPTSLGNATIQATKNTTQVIVTAVTSVNSIRTSPFVFLAGSTTSYPYGTRIVDTKSSIVYNVTAMSWTGNVLTLTHTALPVSAVASIAGQQIYITNSSDPAKIPNNTYLTVSSASQSITTTLVALTPDPGSLTGVTAKVQIGIIPSDADNRGYYTINATVLADVSATATALYTPQINPYPGSTFATIVGTTPASLFGYIAFDTGAGRAAIPQGIPICLDQLQTNKYFTATAASNDAATISFFKTTMFQNY
jgi:hypothetical protein